MAVLAAAWAVGLVAAAPVGAASPQALGGGSVVAAQATVASPPAAPAPAVGKRRAVQWYTNNFDPGPTYNCVTQAEEPLGSAWTGWQGDIGGGHPQVGEVYYVEAGWAITGDPCTGGAGVHDELVLPANTRLAISTNNPVRCFYESPSQGSLHEFGGGDCPQTPQTGMEGGYAFDPPGNRGPWPSASGTITEIHVPVKTTSPLNGIESPDGTPCYTCVYAGVWFIDGDRSPWAWPREGVFVQGTQSQTQPLVTYPGPSVKDIHYRTDVKLVQAELDGEIFSSGPGGTETYEFGTKAGHYTDTLPGPGPIPAGGDFLVMDDFGIPAGRDFHWRFCYQPSGMGEVCGPDQLFQSPPQTGIQDIAVKKRKHKATVTFDSQPIPNMTVHFQCKLDSKPYKACSSPVTYTNLKKGSHTVSVRAVDQDGHTDATPAKQAFKA